MPLSILLSIAALRAQTPKFVPIPTSDGSPSSYAMMATEVTYLQFEQFVKATGYLTRAERDRAARTWRNPGFETLPLQPVTYVTFDDASAYCAWIDARIPSDAEWEQAAGAGAKTRHYWGEAIDSRYLWFRQNSGGRPQPVGTKLPNPYGLFDVEGNVWEWTSVPTEPGEDPLANRRGGSWVDCEDIESAPGKPPGQLIGLSKYFKIPLKLHHRYDDIGFRCARTLSGRKQ
ncbi:MAG: SUMF1/EgtB/PvdO family nonheme iron enzyme [Bryobacterales bacterium]|nr:SUMF1/EgtB/PvdO family nonheme iron enzyme [Bryobacterales bacterium]